VLQYALYRYFITTTRDVKFPENVIMGRNGEKLEKKTE
jgi:hypothetical protein